MLSVSQVVERQGWIWGKEKMDDAIREPESPLDQLNVWGIVHEIYALASLSIYRISKRVRRCWQKLYVARVTGSRVERIGSKRRQG